MTRTQKKWLFRALALLLALAIALPLGELLVRILLTATYRGSLRNLPPGLPQDPNKKVELCELVAANPNPRIAYSFKPGASGLLRGVQVRINELGFRDDPLAPTSASQTLRVLGLGDSTMFGLGVEHEQCYMELLEDEFKSLLGKDWNVQFIDTGVPGYNSVQEVETLLERGLALRPDAVLIQYDNNDTMMPPPLVRPDFLRARHCFVTHPRALLAGQYSDAGSLFLIGQEDRLYADDNPLGGWPSVRDAYRRLAVVCRDKNIPLFVLTTFEDFPPIDIRDRPDENHERFLDLCRELKLNVIQSYIRANAYLVDTQRDYFSIVMSKTDPHPNLIGHGLIAQAALPVLKDALLARRGVKPESLDQRGGLGNVALRQISGVGMYPAERWYGERVNWTLSWAHFHFIPGGSRLILPLWVGHPDISVLNPVELTLRVDGTATADHPNATLLRKWTFKKGGYYTLEMDLRSLAGCPLELSLQVNRTFRTDTNPSPLGVALYDLRFAENNASAAAKRQGGNEVAGR